MANFFGLGSSCVRRSLYTLTTLTFLIGNTSHAFAPASTHVSFLRSHGALPIVSKSVSKSSLASHSVLQIVHHAAVSVPPKTILLLKDASGPLSSILEPIYQANPDTEAEFLMDISHILLDFTAFFKFDGKFLNYAQLAGRIAFLMIDLLPGHAFNIEETAVQIFLLGLHIQKMMPEETKPKITTAASNPLKKEQRFDPNRQEATIASSMKPWTSDEEMSIMAWEEAELEMSEPL